MSVGQTSHCQPVSSALKEKDEIALIEGVYAIVLGGGESKRQKGRERVKALRGAGHVHKRKHAHLQGRA